MIAKIIRGILAIVLGWVLGSIVNLGILKLGGWVVPPPEGIDTSTIEGLRESMSMMKFKHYVFPFLSHSLGTLCGAFVAGCMAASHK